jgi:hypothetical protein
MGQQQLLLIVLGVLIVGMSIYGGVRIMNDFNQDNDRDQLISQMLSIVSEARKFAARPTYLGGGEGTLTGFTPPQNMATTDRFRIYSGSTDQVLTLTGFGIVTGNDDRNPVNVVMTFTLDDNTTVSELVN